MSIFIAQRAHTVRRGNSSLLTTVVRLTSKSDSVELPNMSAASNTVVQLRRPNDPNVEVSQTDIDTVALTGNVGDEILLVSLHQDPMPEPR